MTCGEHGDMGVWSYKDFSEEKLFIVIREYNIGIL